MPETEGDYYRGLGKLIVRLLSSRGDSGIGQAVSIIFAKEAADVAIIYLNDHDTAEDTRQRVERTGRRCITIAGDLGHPEFCRPTSTKPTDRSWPWA